MSTAPEGELGQDSPQVGVLWVLQARLLQNGPGAGQLPNLLLQPGKQKPQRCGVGTFLQLWQQRQGRDREAWLEPGRNCANCGRLLSQQSPGCLCPWRPTHFMSGLGVLCTCCAVDTRVRGVCAHCAVHTCVYPVLCTRVCGVCVPHAVHMYVQCTSACACYAGHMRVQGVCVHAGLCTCVQGVHTAACTLQVP